MGTSFEMFRGHCVRKHHNWQHCFIPTVGVEEAHPDKDDNTLPSVSTSDIATHGVLNNYNSGDQDDNKVTSIFKPGARLVS